MNVAASGRNSRFGNPQLLFVVDAEFADSVSRTRWSSTSYGYLESVEPGTKKKLSLHRFVWLLKHGWCPDILDHINGVRWDCRISNLRPATRSLNSRNRIVRRVIDLPRGVTIRRSAAAFSATRYRARIRLNGKQIELGCFPTAELASECYQNACRWISSIESEQAKKEAIAK